MRNAEATCPRSFTPLPSQYPAATFGLVCPRHFFQISALTPSESVILCVGLAFLFLRFSGGTGWVILLVLGGGMVFVMYHSPGIHLLIWPVLAGLIGLNEWLSVESDDQSTRALRDRYAKTSRGMASALSRAAATKAGPKQKASIQ